MKRSISLVMAFAMCVLMLSGCQKSQLDHELDSTEDTTCVATTEGVTESLNAWETPLTITWNPKVWNEYYTEAFGDTMQTSYENFIDAVMAGEDTFTCVKVEDSYYMQTVSQVCCPVMEVVVDFFELRCDDDGTCHIVYTVDQETKDQMITDFGNDVEEMVSSCLMESDTDEMKAFMLHNYYSMSITYDYDFKAPVEAYYGIVDRFGICQTFAGALAHLYLQVGIPATTTGGLSYDGSVAHDWVLAEINDELYYIDPTFENGDGVGINYFGMTTDRREVAGDFDPTYFNVGGTNEIWDRDIDVSDYRYAEMWFATELTSIERTGDELIITFVDNEGETIEYVMRRA